MSDDHYRRGDPESGCALLMFGAIIVILLVMGAAIVLLLKAMGLL